MSINFDDLLVGFYPTCTDKIGELKTFNDFVRDVKCPMDDDLKAARMFGLKYARCEDETEKERLKDEYGKKKKQLPLWTPCHKAADRSQEAEAVPNGLITLDIDGLKPEDCEKVKEALKTVPYVCFACISISGAGVVAYINSTPNVLSKAEAVEECWRLICEYVSIKSGVRVEPDNGCKDIKRGRFATHDAEPYINEEAKEYRDLRDIETLANEIFQKSEFARLAKLVGGYSATRDYMPTWSSNCGVVQKLLALATRGVVEFSVKENGASYPLRSHSTTLGILGAGKSEESNSIYDDIVKELGGQSFAGKSDALIAEKIRRYCYDQEKDEEGNTVFKPKAEPVPLLIDIEEEGDIGKGDSRAEWAKRKTALFNIFFDKVYRPEELKEDAQFDIPAARVCVVINGRSTPKAYLDGKAREDVSSGVLRRKWYYWVDRPYVDEDCDLTDSERAKRHADEQDLMDCVPLPNVEELKAETLKRRPQYDLMSNPLKKYWKVDPIIRRAVTQALNAKWPREYETLNTALDTILPQGVFAMSYARDYTTPTISDDDYIGGAALVFGMLYSLDRLLRRSQADLVTSEEKILANIREYIKARNEPTYSQVKRDMLKRGSQYMDALEQMWKSELIRFKDDTIKGYRVRFASDEEAEALALLYDMDLKNPDLCAGFASLGADSMRAVRDSWETDWKTIDGGRRPWNECAEDVQDKRMNALLEKAFARCVDNGSPGRYETTRGVMYWLVKNGAWNARTEEQLRVKAVDERRLQERHWRALCKSTRKLSV